MRIVIVVLATGLGACATAISTPPTVEVASTAASRSAFTQDRSAILAMAGEYDVTFDFRETVPLMAGYDLKDPKLSGGQEIVRVIEDRGDFISLQHILVVGEERKFPIKHWRQDWTYEPDAVLGFLGGNAWEMRPVAPDEAAGAWSQSVYQVDDSPRYGAVARWSHQDGIAEWDANAAWRPLPRRDMTTRGDYHAMNAANRHAITPTGWVHEQDNTKIALSEATPQALVREVGLNTYAASEDAPAMVADDYWAATKDYWAEVRAAWTALEASGEPFALTVKGESGAIYIPLLGLADAVSSGKKTVAAASEEARAHIAAHVTTDLPTLTARLRAPDAHRQD